jgi:ABC-type Na+ transport system ATPase subunit NatA
MGVRRSIGVTAQDATVDELLTGRQNLVMIGCLAGLSRRQAKVTAADLLERFGLASAADRVLKGYSGGMRRRLDLAAGIVTRPPVLFLDEPTTGLDPASRQAMWDVIRDLVADGATLLLTTQYLDEAGQLADHIVVIDHGRVIADGTARSLILVGRTVSDLLGATLCAATVAVTGLAMGWRPQEHRLRHRRVRDLPSLQLCAVLGLHLPRPRHQQPRISPGHRPGDPLPARVHLQRARPHRAHARRLPGSRRLEPPSAPSPGTCGPTPTPPQPSTPGPCSIPSRPPYGRPRSSRSSRPSPPGSTSTAPPTDRRPNPEPSGSHSHPEQADLRHPPGPASTTPSRTESAGAISQGGGARSPSVMATVYLAGWP